ALDQLDPRSQRIIRARWLSDEGADSLTLHDLAAEFGVSAERIRQIEVKALLRLRQLLAHYA
ncbi:MAG: RNA polymerase sigma factor RpoH, partial [Betaproteobacteria bacterium]|nr:RNA polymerase sigma factor RpoH [Betaproteobacteria bacterium]